MSWTLYGQTAHCQGFFQKKLDINWTRRNIAPMSSDSAPSESFHPIQVVARRTGLTPDVLRAWERRYGAVRPKRSPGNRRFYTDEDVDRLRLLRSATLRGRSIGQVASFTTDELRQLVEKDEAASSPKRRTTESERRSGSGEGAAEHLESCLEAVSHFDVTGLEAALGRASVLLSPMVVVGEVLVPLMNSVGESWRNGSMRIAQEHMATAVVRTFLGNLARIPNHAENAPAMVVATPTGQLHELGALIAAGAAISMGWKVSYLGPDLPAEEIAAACARTESRAVSLGLCYPRGDARTIEQMKRLRQLLGEDVEILVGGLAALSYADSLAAIGAERLDSIEDFLGSLEQRMGGTRR